MPKVQFFKITAILLAGCGSYFTSIEKIIKTTIVKTMFLI